MKNILNLEGADDFVTSSKDLQDISGSMLIIVKDCANILEHNFPGWLWAVQPFEAGSIIKIFSLHISGEYGYIIKVADIQNDPKRRLALEAGGEILERYGLPRGPYSRELLLHKPRDIRGNLIPDLTDKEGKVQKQDRDRKVTAAVREGKMALKAEDKQMPDGTVRREISMKIGGEDA